jgi:hypothetical protein
MADNNTINKLNNALDYYKRTNYTSKKTERCSEKAEYAVYFCDSKGKLVQVKAF